MAAKKQQDLFAPPTEDELKSDLFAPPTKEEIGAGDDKPTVSGKGLLKSTLEALPMAGSMFGGAIGTGLGAAPGLIPFLTPAAPMTAIAGGVAGAGLGASAGKALQNIGEKYLLGEEKTRKQVYQEPIEEGILGTTAEMGGQLIAPAAKLAGKGIKKAVSAASRIPTKSIETYLERGADVEKLISKYGGDTQDSANALRQEINEKIQSFKSKQNAQISKSLSSRNDIIDVTKASDELQKVIKGMDPDIEADKIATIQKELDLINKVAPNGLLPIKSANALKQKLQDLSDYLEPGKFFKKKGLIDVSFERAAAAVNKEITKAAPEIKAANKNLQSLRRATKNLNRNILTEGQTEASLLSAAQGQDKNSLALRNLEALTGESFIPQIENIAAQRSFAEPGLLPSVNTGAATLPLLLSGAGAVYGGISEGDLSGAGKGLLLGGVGSPLAIKYGSKLARPLLRGARAAEPVLRQAPKGLLMVGE